MTIDLGFRVARRFAKYGMPLDFLSDLVETAKAFLVTQLEFGFHRATVSSIAFVTEFYCKTETTPVEFVILLFKMAMERKYGESVIAARKAFKILLKCHSSSHDFPDFEMLPLFIKGIEDETLANRTKEVICQFYRGEPIPDELLEVLDLD